MMANRALRILQQVGRWKTKIRLVGKIPPDPPSPPNVTEAIAQAREAIAKMKFPTGYISHSVDDVTREARTVAWEEEFRNAAWQHHRAMIIGADSVV
jgi:hypothetical protein